jgi:aryl sulfotransferase
MSCTLVLIASYPKSGNTWTRLVFEKLRRGRGFSMNSLDGSYQGIHRRLLFDRIMPVNAADLRSEEVENLLPEMYRQLAAETSDSAFVKVHDNIRRTRWGEWIYPPDCVRAAIYLTRHPFDVAVSNANHFGISIEMAVELLAEQMAPGIETTTLPESLDQVFGTWSQHVASWLDDAPYRLTVARYEDLLSDPVAGFVRLARASGLDNSADDVVNAVETSHFAVLQEEEIRSGFRERPETCGQFFHSGRMRSWEGVLDQGLRDRLVKDHGAAMERMGYTPDGGVEPWNADRAFGSMSAAPMVGRTSP